MNAEAIKNTTRKRPMSGRMYQFGNIAMRYYPDRGYKTALRLFRKEIIVTKGLHKALLRAGYHDHQRLLTRQQMSVIEDHLGEAG